MQSVISVYFDQGLREQMSSAPTLAAIGMIAAALVKSIPGGVEMVFGPVTHGGVILANGPSYSNNIRVIDATLSRLQSEGHTVFNQLLFRPYIDRQRKIWIAKHNRSPRTYYEPLKHEFYAAILDTDNVSVGNFIYGWKKGRVPKFANEILEKQKKKIIELPEGFHQQQIAA